MYFHLGEIFKYFNISQNKFHILYYTLHRQYHKRAWMVRCWIFCFYLCKFIFNNNSPYFFCWKSQFCPWYNFIKTWCNQGFSTNSVVLKWLSRPGLWLGYSGLRYGPDQVIAKSPGKPPKMARLEIYGRRAAKLPRCTLEQLSCQSHRWCTLPVCHPAL